MRRRERRKAPEVIEEKDTIRGRVSRDEDEREDAGNDALTRYRSEYRRIIERHRPACMIRVYANREGSIRSARSAHSRRKGTLERRENSAIEISRWKR